MNLDVRAFKDFRPKSIFTRNGGHHMKISYDPAVDALSITFRDTTVTTKHLAEGIAADYDAVGN